MAFDLILETRNELEEKTERQSETRKKEMEKSKADPVLLEWLNSSAYFVLCRCMPFESISGVFDEL